ncbi:MAG: DUF1080 domain-containing protein [Bryobacteraceae bacterium]
MRTLSWIASAALLAAAPNTLTQKEIDEGWVSLFDGETMFGWYPQGPAKWSVENGALVTDGQGGLSWIRSGSQWADYVLKLEFRAAEKANSGVFLRSATVGEPHKTGYELQIWVGNEKFPTGSLVGHASTKKGKFKGDVWNAYEVRAEGDHFVIKLNGKQVLDTHDGKSKIGHIGFQANGHKIEFRDVKIKPLGLQAIFNGKDLSGWHEVKTPRAKEPPVWSVKAGAIHVEKGPGQLETEKTWDDLVFQLAVKTNPKDANHHPNSGVFLRGVPNTFWSGYETQIRNEYKDGDRTKAVDFGTGGVYHYQPARKVMGTDGQYFVKTVVARGKHLATWINGYPVADWDDPNPEGDAVVRNKQSKVAAGAISLQAHDPTTNLDFKNLRIAALPKQ